MARQVGWRGKRADLERLRIPVPDLLDARHLVELVGKLVELFDAMRESDRQLLWRRSAWVSWSGRATHARTDLPCKNSPARSRVPAEGF